ncbi:MAG: DegT/DnrJ/EryC1/StrS family aminotransferase [Flexilinea sp.]
MEIKANDISRHFFQHQKEYEEKTLAVLRSGHFILGEEVKAFEDEFAGCMRAAFCVGLGNGLDALWLSFRILGIGKGDEVIVPANTYIASVMGITINGATPIFVEPDEFFTIDTKKIESKITGKTKAVLSVNLYGQACQMQELREICDRKHLFLVEDSAQSHGARYNDQFTNYYADISCFSFYPTKNLGCFGDGGAILTDHPEFADAFRIYRNYGSEKRYYNQVVGANSRLDEIQAGFLRIKLKYLAEINEERKLLAARYSGSISNPLIMLPKLRPNTTSVWHQYVIRCSSRDRLKDYLKENGIDSIVHYPIPPHLSGAYRSLGYRIGDFPITETYADSVLSLPMFNGMTESEQEYVIHILNCFPG